MHRCRQAGLHCLGICFYVAEDDISSRQEDENIVGTAGVQPADVLAEIGLAVLLRHFSGRNLCCNRSIRRPAGNGMSDIRSSFINDPVCLKQLSLIRTGSNFRILSVRICAGIYCFVCGRIAACS